MLRVSWRKKNYKHLIIIWQRAIFSSPLSPFVSFVLSDLVSFLLLSLIQLSLHLQCYVTRFVRLPLNRWVFSFLSFICRLSKNLFLLLPPFCVPLSCVNGTNSSLLYARSGVQKWHFQRLNRSPFLNFREKFVLRKKNSKKENFIRCPLVFNDLLHLFLPLLLSVCWIAKYFFFRHATRLSFALFCPASGGIWCQMVLAFNPFHSCTYTRTFLYLCCSCFYPESSFHPSSFGGTDVKKKKESSSVANSRYFCCSIRRLYGRRKTKSNIPPFSALNRLSRLHPIESFPLTSVHVSQTRPFIFISRFSSCFDCLQQKTLLLFCLSLGCSKIEFPKLRRAQQSQQVTVSPVWCQYSGCCAFLIDYSRIWLIPLTPCQY